MNQSEIYGIFSTRCVFWFFPITFCVLQLKKEFSFEQSNGRECVFYEQKKHKNKTPLKLLVLRELELSRLVNAGRAFHVEVQVCFIVSHINFVFCVSKNFSLTIFKNLCFLSESLPHYHLFVEDTQSSTWVHMYWY